MNKREIKFQDYKQCLKNNKTILTSQQRLRREANNVSSAKVTKIVLVTNDDSRIQTPDGVISYPYGKGPGRLFKEEMMRHQQKKTEYNVTLMKSQEKIHKITTYAGRKFLTIHTEY